MTHPLPNGTRVRVRPPALMSSSDTWTGRTMRVIGWIPDGRYRLEVPGAPIDWPVDVDADRVAPMDA